MDSLPEGYRAVVIGSTGGIGSAFLRHLSEDGRCSAVIGLSRSTSPAIDFHDEKTIQDAAEHIGKGVHLIVDATGFLSDETIRPEKSLRALDPYKMATLFAANATGPALLMKHLLPLMPRDERAIFATLSARVGSIADNQLGGWYAYRASKAALNMIVKCAAIEFRRTHDQAICVAMHPGTVETSLSDPFAGKRVRTQPEQAARSMLSVLDQLVPGQTGSFFAYDGSEIVW